jgi:hypothetical protein
MRQCPDDAFALIDRIRGASPTLSPDNGGEDKGEGVKVFTAKARRAQSKEFLINKYSLGELGVSAVK